MTGAGEERNVALVRRFIDGAVNGGDLAVLDETWADDMTWHGGSMGTYEGKPAFLEFAAANAAGAWADMHLEIHELIAHDDKVVARFTNSGTNVGPFMNNLATGKHAEWLGIGIYTLRNGRITEGWFAEAEARDGRWSRGPGSDLRAADACAASRDRGGGQGPFPA